MSTRIPPYDIPEPTPLTKEQLRDKQARFQSLRSELSQSFSGPIALRGEPLFAKSVTIFNDAAPLGAWMVTLPASALEISAIVKFCNAHDISPSVKSGGFATAGWSIQGEVVIDTSKMDDVQLVIPTRSIIASSNSVANPGSSPITVPSVAPSSAVTIAGQTALETDRISAEIDGSTIKVQSGSVGAVDQATRQSLENPLATPIHEGLIRKSEHEEDVDPQDASLAPPKLRARTADEAFGPASDASSLDPQTFHLASVRRKLDERAASDAPSGLVAPEPSRSGDVKSQAMQHGRSTESGADADSESSFDGSDHEGDKLIDTPERENSNEGDLNATGRNRRASSRREYMTDSEPRDVARPFSAPKPTQPSKIWIDRQLDRSGNDSASPSGSNSGSVGGGSSSNLASSHTSLSKQSSAKSSSIGGDGSDRRGDAAGGEVSTNDSLVDDAFKIEPSSMVFGPSDSIRPSLSGSRSGSNSDLNRNERAASNSQTPDDWDASSSFEHARWHRHHRPPSNTPGERLKLPEGGFVWRSEGADAGVTSISGASGPLPWDAEAFAASPEAGRPRSNPGSVHSSGEGSSSEFDPNRQSRFAASTLTDLQDAWPAGTWAVNSEAANDPASNLPRFIPSPLQKYTSPSPGPSPSGIDGMNPFNFDSRPEAYHQLASSILPPGMYEDRYALASFGPGAGIRGLDAFTDRAGREGNFLANTDDKSKGKERAGEDSPDLPLVVNGVPYHVPVSAYPVGSTAMTTGGFGYLTRAYGLSLDNIVEVEMVLADGRIVTLNEESKNKSQEEKDLWWAVRGAAPCFGIVSRLTAKAYPVPSVYSGNLIYPLNPATASSLIRHWRDCLKAGLPRTFYSNLILTAGPSKTSHVIVIQVCFLGPKSEGEALVQAISSWTGERLLLKDVEERSFLAQQDGVAKVLKGGIGRRWMVRGDLISTLTDDVISQSVRKFQGLGSRAVWLFELMGGAVEDSPADDTCICPEARAAKFTVGSLQQWSGKAEDRTCIESVERWLTEVVGKVSVGGPYPCFLGRSERMDRVIGAYGVSNFRRLVQIKKKVDPKNMFRHTFGHGFHVDSLEEMIAELEVREAERKRKQQEASASSASAGGTQPTPSQ